MAADIYAVALTITQVWTLERPFARVTPYKFLLMLKDGKLTGVERPTQVPARVWAEIKDCLHLDALERPTAQRLLAGFDISLVE